MQHSPSIFSACAWLAVMVGCQPEAEPTESMAGTVQVEIDFGKGRSKTFADVPCRRGATVIEALEEAAGRDPGFLFTYRGEGAAAFVVSIDGVKNEGSGEGARNWIFLVNGEKATEGAGVYEVIDGDAVLWKFTAEE